MFHKQGLYDCAEESFSVLCESVVPHGDMLVTHPTDAASLPSLEERQRLLERVAASEGFRKAARLRQLLLFLAERSFQGPQDSIKEQEIGVEVFCRNPGYDPGADNIVRNAARQLRVKLKEYFDGEGLAEPWFLDIPKGGYRLICEPRKTAATPAPASIASPRLVAILGLLLAISVSLNLLQVRSAQPASPGSALTLAADLFPPGSPSPRIVTGDFGLFLLSNLQKKRFSLNDYVDRAYLNFSPPPLSPPTLQSFGDLLSSRQLVSMGEVNSAISLVKCLSALSHQPEVRHARTVTARDLRERPSILLGTDNTNPWFGLFDQRLQFRLRGGGFESVADPSLRFGGGPAVASGGRVYARVAMLRLPNGGKVLLVSGLNMSAVDGGAEFVVGERALADLRNKLLQPAGELPEFEAIVETQSADFTPTQYRLAWAAPIAPPAIP
jgi:hypothetical protein